MYHYVLFVLYLCDKLIVYILIDILYNKVMHYVFVHWYIFAIFICFIIFHIFAFLVLYIDEYTKHIICVFVLMHLLLILCLDTFKHLISIQYLYVNIYFVCFVWFEILFVFYMHIVIMCDCISVFMDRIQLLCVAIYIVNLIHSFRNQNCYCLNFIKYQHKNFISKTKTVLVKAWHTNNGSLLFI